MTVVTSGSKKMHSKTVADCSIDDIHEMILSSTVYLGDEGLSISLHFAKIIKLLAMNDFISVLNFVEAELESKLDEQGYQSYSPRYIMGILRDLHEESITTLNDEAIELYEGMPAPLLPVISRLTNFDNDV